VDDPIRRIVASYRDPLIRIYSRVRFIILRQIFLEEIGQYLPREGRILDVGCGFGLFSLYFAMLCPDRRIVGIDRDARRIAHARASAERLALSNVEYRLADARSWDGGERFEAAYALDVVHHLPRVEVAPFLAKLRDGLAPRGLLLLKEVEDRPAWKRWFTLALDRLVVGREPVHYWPAAELVALLESLGFDVVRHRMRDLLPYPHILYVARLRDA
jgi:2-polyprenyl-6-hydroxyphenyl methylase/3-demethylubiquinone-9 3-methyltransferase